MLLSSLLSLTLAPLAVLAGTPGALLSLSGRDYSHHLRRTDEPFPVRLAYAKRGPASVPRTLLEPAIPVRRAGILVAERQLSCDQGLTACSDGNGCCPQGAECCTQVAMCCTGGSCCGTSCCENNGVCCGTEGCCDAGSTCTNINGVTGCCKAGQNCDAFSGCSNSSLVECGGDNHFCCPSGETCGRDAQGNATCNGQSATDQEVSTGVATPSQGNTVLSAPGASNSATTSSSSSTSRSGSSSVSHTGSTTATVTSPTGSSTSTATTSTQTSSTGGALMNAPAVHGIAGLLAGALVWLI